MLLAKNGSIDTLLGPDQNTVILLPQINDTARRDARHTVERHP
jgi:hypothetical protein